MVHYHIIYVPVIHYIYSTYNTLILLPRTAVCRYVVATRDWPPSQKHSGDWGLGCRPYVGRRLTLTLWWLYSELLLIKYSFQHSSSSGFASAVYLLVVDQSYRWLGRLSSCLLKSISWIQLSPSAHTIVLVGAFSCVKIDSGKREIVSCWKHSMKIDEHWEC